MQKESRRKDFWRKTMTKQEQSEKIVYGSLITSTKCYNCIHFPLCFAQKGAANLEFISENNCYYYQSKLPEDSIVLSKSEKQKLLKEMYEQGRFDAIADLDKEGKVVLTREEKEEYESLIKLFIYDKPMKNRVYEVIKDIKQQTRKETAEKIIIFLDDHCDCDSAYLVEQTKDYATKQFGVEIKE